MGNRAVIVAHDTTKENRNRRIGIYLHWCGGKESVEEFLQIAKQRGIRGVDSDPQYCWARLCQIICDEFSSEGENCLSVGIGIVRCLDCQNYDNGVYYINEKFDIVKQTDGSELEDNLEEGEN